MAVLNTPEQNGRLMLEIFVGHFKSRPGNVLRANSFVAMMGKYNLRADDLNGGLAFAAENEWIEVLEDGQSFRLTKAGFDQA
jgi:hypothetical protein